MKIKNIKSKVAAKVAKGKEKVAAKCGKTKKACAAVLMAALFAAVAGCKMGEQPTAQRAQTADTRVEFVVKDGGKATFTFGAEFVSLAQANETSGTEAFTSSPTSTPTVDVKPDVDVTVPVSKGAGGAAADAASSLAEASVKGAAKAFTNDAACPDGSCNPGGSCTTGACVDL